MRRLFVLVEPEAPTIRPYITTEALHYVVEGLDGPYSRALSREELLSIRGGPQALMDWLNHDTSQAEADDAWMLADSEAEDRRLEAMTPLERQEWARGQERWCPSP